VFGQGKNRQMDFNDKTGLRTRWQLGVTSEADKACDLDDATAETHDHKYFYYLRSGGPQRAGKCCNWLHQMTFSTATPTDPRQKKYLFRRVDTGKINHVATVDVTKFDYTQGSADTEGSWTMETQVYVYTATGKAVDDNYRDEFWADKSTSGDKSTKDKLSKAHIKVTTEGKGGKLSKYEISGWATPRGFKQGGADDEEAADLGLEFVGDVNGEGHHEWRTELFAATRNDANQGTTKRWVTLAKHKGSHTLQFFLGALFLDALSPETLKSTVADEIRALDPKAAAEVKEMDVTVKVS